MVCGKMAVASAPAVMNVGQETSELSVGLRQQQHPRVGGHVAAIRHSGHRAPAHGKKLQRQRRISHLRAVPVNRLSGDSLIRQEGSNTCSADRKNDAVSAIYADVNNDISG